MRLLWLLLATSQVPDTAETSPPIEDSTAPSAAVEADPAPTELAPAPSQPGMSWDLLGGGVPDEGVLASARIGFSRLGEIRLEVPVLRELLIGAWVGLDLGYWTPAGADADGGFVFGATARWSLLHDNEWSIGASVSPGGRLRFGSIGGGGVIVPVSAKALYAIDRRFLLGAAVDVPIRLSFPDRGPNDVIFALPITVGLAAETHLSPSFALTAEIGIGPSLDTRGVETAFRGVIGAGYRL